MGMLLRLTRQFFQEKTMGFRMVSYFVVPPILGVFLPTLGLAEEKPTNGLQSFVDRQVLAGAVTLVASPDKILQVEAVGFADIAQKKPIKPDCLFWIASMNKPITATAFMMLVDEGKIKLEDPIEKYLPEFRNQLVIEKRDGDRLILKKPTRPITVRDILSHTSGMVGRSPLENQLDSVSLREGVISYGLSPLQTEPGTKYDYCNPGINTVGRLIEVVSGMPYEDFLQKRLFDPLGMKDTTFWPSEEQMKRLAKSYKPSNQGMGLEEIIVTQLTYPLTSRKRHPYPAGGLFSTAHDMALFCQLILNHGKWHGQQLLSEESIRQMTSTQTGKLIDKERGEGGYGLGWSTGKKYPGKDGPVIPAPCGHGGAYATDMRIEPERQRILIYLVQHAGFPGNEGGKVYSAFYEDAMRRFGK